MGHEPSVPKYPFPVSDAYLREIFHDCVDLFSQTVTIPAPSPYSITLYWMDGLVDNIVLAEDILRPLTDPDRLFSAATPQALFTCIAGGQLYGTGLKLCHSTDVVVSELLVGHCVILFPHTADCIAFDVRSVNMRSISEPTLEKTVKGAKEAFIESMKVNITLLRRKLQTPKLKVVTLKVGRKSSTPVSIIYIEGVAKEDTVQRLRQNLDTLDIDGLITCGYLEQYLVSSPRSLFPQLLHTERPDTFTAMLLEGRVGLLTEGIPVGFLVPAPLSRFMQVSEDSAQQFWVASMLTFIRYAALLLATLLPAIYVAISMYHQEMIPTQMLSSMIEAKQKVPFSTGVEVLGMLISFELLQEAGLRLPNPVGDTVSIIGALIVGQAAVEAHIVSPIAVIIVAFSSISACILPCQDLSAAIRILRLSCVLIAMGTGMFGVAALSGLLIWYLCTMESYGVCYLAPFVDDSWHGWVRSLFKRPLWRNRFRDKFAAGYDNRRSK